MKKLVSMMLMIIALVTLSITAFATNADNVEAEVLAPEDIVSIEETKDSDDLFEVCPKCGKVHDGCCDQEFVRPHVKFKNEEYITFCDMKDNALYFITPDSNLMLMNLKTKELIFIKDKVAGLTRYGMNGRYIGYVTLKDEFFSVPYGIGNDGKLSTDFQQEFGE